MYVQYVHYDGYRLCFVDSVDERCLDASRVTFHFK